MLNRNLVLSLLLFFVCILHRAIRPWMLQKERPGHTQRLRLQKQIQKTGKLYFCNSFYASTISMESLWILQCHWSIYLFEFCFSADFKNDFDNFRGDVQRKTLHVYVLFPATSIFTFIDSITENSKAKFGILNYQYMNII